MDNDKLKDIPLEIVGTTADASEEDIVVQEGEALPDVQPTTADTPKEPEHTGSKPEPTLALTDSSNALPKSKKRKPNNKSAEEELVREGIELKNALADQAREEEREGSFNLSLKKILVGDVLNSRLLRENVGLMIVIVVFIVIGITNRYTVQQNMLVRSKLEKELQDTKFRALSASSDLTERTRKSRIIEGLRDSTLKEPEHPAFLIEVPTK